MFGRENNLPLTVKLNNPRQDNNNFCQSEYVLWVQDTLERIYSYVRVKIEASVKSQKQNYDTKIKPREIEVGMKVWRWYPPHAKLKFGLGWIGPYTVTTIYPGKQVAYIEKEGKSTIAHINDLKPCISKFNITPESDNAQEEQDEEEEDTVKEAEPIESDEEESDSDEQEDIEERETKYTKSGRPVRPPRRLISS